MSQSKQEPIPVEIYGQIYNVRGGGDPTYLSELAQFVDTRMREVASQGSLLDPLKVAILAALNIADEYQQFRIRQDGAVDRWVDRTKELNERLGRITDEAEPI